MSKFHMHNRHNMIPLKTDILQDVERGPSHGVKYNLRDLKMGGGATLAKLARDGITARQDLLFCYH